MTDIDKRIAEEVMGECWHNVCLKKQVDMTTPIHDNSVVCDCGKEFPEWQTKYCENPKYSTDIKAAFTVVEKMRENGEEDIDRLINFNLYYSYDDKKWNCTFGGIEHFVMADTAPMAICLAALATKGEEG